ncbi:hydrolase, putative [Marinomonas sp. MED121]|uniref:alpha/beta hydrolase n=1 Tax=Marinomonas sp. MED121 TaxID=314277 RepID=UPI0000690506|nr:alpha/beta hydrolase [Marinomonas sp. MED121]EAQ64676.1 hydrolase, putative [Marinomonas sp. MED121]
MNIAFAFFRLKNQLNSFFASTRTAHKMADAFLQPKRSEMKDWELKAELKGERFSLSDEVSAIRWRSDAEEIKGQILLVHGWESRATHLYGFAEVLLAQGYHLIALDMPGHGRSPGRTSNAHQFAQTLLLAEQKLGEFNVIIGHSMGASAVSIAVGNGLSPSKMVLISGPSSIENSIRHFTHIIGFNKRTSDHFIGRIAHYVGVPFHQLDSTNLLKECDIPTLLIHDESDKEVLPSESHRLNNVLLNAYLMTTQGYGHRKILKAQPVLKAIAEFVANESAFLSVGKQKPS